MHFNKFCVVGLLALLVHESHGATVASPVNITTQSITQLIKQIQNLVSNIEGLVSGPLQNGVADLTVASDAIKYLVSQNLTDGAKILNSTLKSISNVATNIRNQATGNGVSITGCTNTTGIDILYVSAGFIANLSACAIDKASEGLQMINNDISYISSIANMTTAVPINVAFCTKANSTTITYYCLKNLLANTANSIVNVPMTVTSMVNDAYSFVNLFPTNMAVCATNSTLAAVVNGATLGLAVTTCIAETILGLK